MKRRGSLDVLGGAVLLFATAAAVITVVTGDVLQWPLFGLALVISFWAADSMKKKSGD